MKKIITLLITSVALLASTLVRAEDRVLIIKPYFATTVSTTTNWGGADAQNEEKYIMTKVDGEDNLYMCTLTLDKYFKTNKWAAKWGETYSPNEGWSDYYQYLVVYQDSYTLADNGSVTGNSNPKPFTVEADGTTVTFYARLVQDGDYNKDAQKYAGKIRSFCDAQAPKITIWNDADSIMPAAIGQESSKKQIFVNGAGKKEITLYSGKEWMDIISDQGLPKHVANARGRHIVNLDYKTIFYAINKVLDETETPQVKIGSGELQDAATLTGNLGTFALGTPLLINGDIIGKTVTDNGTKINTDTVTSYMCCEIIPENETNGIITRIPLTTPRAETSTATWTGTETNLTDDLDNGTYTLKVWYEMIAFDDTLKNDNNGAGYTATFIINNDFTLNTLTVSEGILDPVFDAGTKTYTVNVAKEISSITINAIANAAYEVSGTGEKTLDFGVNTFKVAVSPTGSNLSTVYTITVNRAKNTDATLSALTVSIGTLSPEFNAATTDYTVSVPYAITSVEVSATATDVTYATVEGTGPQTLDIGANEVEIEVTAQDGSTETYTVTITRAKNTDATLSALTVSEGTLSPAFDANTTDYTVSVPYSVTSVNVVATVNDDVNATAAGAGEQTLDVGANEVEIIVTAHDESTKTYTIIITRAKNDDATLSTLTVSEGTLSPAFDANTTDYTVSVPYNVTSVNVVATVNDDVNATATGAGDQILDVGANEVEIIVTAHDESTKTYTIIITRAKNNDATLSTLTVSTGTLSPAFDSNTTDYTVSVPNATASVEVTATATDTDNANVVGDGNKDLIVGDNPITITVTAHDGSTKEYHVIINRAQTVGLNQNTDDNVKIWTNNSMIQAQFTNEAVVKLYSLTGNLLLEQICNETFSVSVKAGYYIIDINNKAYKVVVK